MLIEPGTDSKQPSPKLPAQPAPKRAARSARHRWHAVTIVARGSACGAAQACRGRRFLSHEAPRLPLPECDAAACDCRYRHFDDRRGPPRRAEEGPPARVKVDRREKRGRRSTD
ncbi:MAG TPA: hypothetical protein VME42_11040 [Steroidobacteraceae bacterium]|nr:hypothetical protein [Steroidobacteraceae bacterium]